MGATFYISAPDGRPAVRCTCEDGTCPACQLQLDLNCRNVGDLLAHLGFTPAPYGQLPAAWLVSACERRLATGDVDPEIAATVDGRVIYCGRRTGYLASAPSRCCGSRAARGRGGCRGG